MSQNLLSLTYILLGFLIPPPICTVSSCYDLAEKQETPDQCATSDTFAWALHAM
jgi:hypothetical protein